jgi:hypothetical protein
LTEHCYSVRQIRPAAQQRRTIQERDAPEQRVYPALLVGATFAVRTNNCPGPPVAGDAPSITVVAIGVAVNPVALDVLAAKLESPAYAAATLCTPPPGTKTLVTVAVSETEPNDTAKSLLKKSGATRSTTPSPFKSPNATT